MLFFNLPGIRNRILNFSKFNYGFFGFVVSLTIQFLLIGKYLDNSVISAYAPSALDARHYSSLATNWRNEGFTEAFSEAKRTPGYPAIIYLSTVLFPAYPYLAVKVFQLISISVSIGILTFILSQHFKSRYLFLYSFFMGALPIWYFTPQLLAESLTFFIFTIVILIITNNSNSTNFLYTTVTLGILLALMVYLKPNNIILLPLFLLVLVLNNFNSKLLQLVLFGIALFICLLPWLIHVERSQGSFFTLATTQGLNLYIGTGIESDESTNRRLAESADRWQVTQKYHQDNVLNYHKEDPIKINKLLTSKQIDDKYSDVAIKIWKERPWSQLGFSFDKIFIAFGLKSNSLQEYSLGIFNLLAVLGAIYLIIKSTLRLIGIYTLTVAGLLGAQAAAFQCDRRFIISTFLPIAAITIYLSCWKIIENLLGAGRFSDTSEIKKY